MRRLSYICKHTLLTHGTLRPSTRAAVFEQCKAAFLPNIRHRHGLSLHEHQDAHFRSKNKVKKGEWNKLELVSDVDTLEMFLNGESAGKVKFLQPGRANSNCWFGGRPKELFKGSVRDVRVRHGW